MSFMNDDDMTPDEFDRRLNDGEPVELHVDITRLQKSSYNVSITHGGGLASAVRNAAASLSQVRGHKVAPSS